MDCNRAETLLDALLDGELDPPASLELRRHLDECARCRDLHAARGAVRAAVRAQARRYRAPPELRQRVAAALRQAASPADSARHGRIAGGRLNIAASLVLAAALGSAVTYWTVQPDATDRVTEQVVAGHIRSLLAANRVTDIASSDQHTVKPWFNGKLDFSPPVRDLTGEGFALVGGRLDYIAQRPVAALVYRHRQHTINLFVWPNGGGAGERPAPDARQGYHVRHWRDAGMQYWAVSDVNPDDLETFRRLLRDAAVS